MISGIFHKGSGLGNQLHRYVMTRVLALDKGVDFGMVAPELFKGKDFMNLDMGADLGSKSDYYGYFVEPGTGRVVAGTSLPLWNEWDKHCYDPDINFVEDNTIIDGNFEDERYFGHRLPEINKWLETEPLDIPENVCVIGFRGGEYYAVPELGLPREYFSRAIDEMIKLIPNVRFEVHTDDPDRAHAMFVGVADNGMLGTHTKIVHNIDMNWLSMRYAKHAIIANSSFYILPRLLNGGVTIVPRYFNRYNLKRWDFPQFYYKSFRYI